VTVGLRSLARAAGVLVLAALSFRASAQPSLQFFTNYANAALQAQFGFGVTNIPVYSPTNAAIGYTASLHYVLQSAANAYDATTPSTNFGSVFRPLFSWQSNTLYIVSYAAVTNDFYSQTSSGFKDLTDPTITTDDNVWGIPWVIGMKNPVPSFHEYSYSSRVVASRRILFMRATTGDGQPDTNRPPQYTNQFFIMSISNSFGMQLWNSSLSPYTNNVTIVVSNRILMSLTNNYNWGTNMDIVSGGNWPTNFWPAWSGNPISHQTNGSFQIPFSMNSILLPDSYWSDSTGQFIQLTNTPSSPSLFLSQDMEQRGWPVHAWILNITNALMCALIDNQSGQILDYVNLGEFGSSLDITNEIISETDVGQIGSDPWSIGYATDYPNSPMSTGMLNQIGVDQTSDPIYYNSLNGLAANGNEVYPGFTFGTVYIPTNAMAQSCTWEATNPRVHYTLQDVTLPIFGETITALIPITTLLPITNDAESGKLTPEFYDSGKIGIVSVIPESGPMQIQFVGATNLPYGVWASTNLSDWSEIGIANQFAPGNFQFTDTTVTNLPGRFYELRIP
jgi:hypothetical protein